VWFSQIDRPIVIEDPDRSRPWGFFDDASQGNEPTHGGRFVLHLNENHNFHVNMGLGQGSKNWAKVHACRALITFLVEKGEEQDRCPIF